MMEALISIIPGISWACTFFLLLLSFIQFRIYWKKSYLRSKNLALFCFFASIFAFEYFVAQSRIFPPWFTHSYVAVSSVCLCLSLYYYMRSLNYFITVPQWVYQLYTSSALVLAALVVVGILSNLFFGTHLFFNPAEPLVTGNYFVDSYATLIGSPSPYLKNILSASGVMTILGALYMLRSLMKSSQDVYFILGLLFSIFAALKENVLLPLTMDYFVPVVFLSNLSEAFRMNSLSYREYMKEK